MDTIARCRSVATSAAAGSFWNHANSANASRQTLTLDLFPMLAQVLLERARAREDAAPGSPIRRRWRGGEPTKVQSVSFALDLDRVPFPDLQLLAKILST